MTLLCSVNRTTCLYIMYARTIAPRRCARPVPKRIPEWVDVPENFPKNPGLRRPCCVQTRRVFAVCAAAAPPPFLFGCGLLLPRLLLPRLLLRFRFCNCCWLRPLERFPVRVLCATSAADRARSAAPTRGGPVT